MSSTEPVQLDTPVERDGGNVESITLRKPSAGELRGLSLADVIQMDTGTIIKLVPRISQPTLTEQEVGAMDPADLTEVAGKVASFLVQRRHKE